jgi:putative ABC transport system permease protein
MDPVSRTPDVVFPMPATALDKVRSVPGVAWAVPHLRSVASVRTPVGDLEGVSIIGVDDATLIGMPMKLLRGRPEDLAQPDAVFIDDIGARRLFEGMDPIGQRLELNDQRAIVRGIVDVDPSFTAQVVLYTRYSEALNFVPGTRNRMSFVLARGAPGVDPEELSQRVARETGLRVRTRDEFAEDGINFIIENTGIPINFGITVALGFIVGIAIVGLTFSLFIRDNVKQFGALKAIGVHNGRIARMVTAQAALVGLIGYGLGLLMAALFIAIGGATGDAFKGFYIPWQIPTITLVGVVLILAVTGWVALRTVLKTEPASVFR